MAKTVVIPIQLVKDQMSDDLPVTGGTVIDPANTMEIAYPQEGKLLLVLNNTFAGPKVFTVSAGSSRFVASGQGALALSLAQADVRFLVVASDRFLQDDGVLELSFEAATTGFVQAFYLP